MKKSAIIITIVGVIAVAALVYFTKGDRGDGQKKAEDIRTEGQFCYFYEQELSGETGTYSLELDVNGSTASGELRLIQTAEDSKSGSFAGVIGEPAPGTAEFTRVVAAWWDVETPEATERRQLLFVIEDDIARIGFGEMISDGAGAMVYADPQNLYYSLELEEIDCSEMPAA